MIKSIQQLNTIVYKTLVVLILLNLVHCYAKHDTFSNFQTEEPARFKNAIPDQCCAQPSQATGPCSARWCEDQLFVFEQFRNMRQQEYDRFWSETNIDLRAYITFVNEVKLNLSKFIFENFVFRQPDFFVASHTINGTTYQPYQDPIMSIWGAIKLLFYEFLFQVRLQYKLLRIWIIYGPIHESGGPQEQELNWYILRRSLVLFKQGAPKITIWPIANNVFRLGKFSILLIRTTL